MNLPFTPAQFFAVFASYDEGVWPMQFVLVLAAIAMLIAVIRFPERAVRIVSAGLALLWCWLALGYHRHSFGQSIRLPRCSPRIRRRAPCPSVARYI